MKKLNDEEIQKMLEQHLSIPKDDLTEDSKDDMAAYQFLFESMEKEPAEGLPYDFSKKVARKVQAQVNSRQERKWSVYITLIIMAAFGGVYGFMALFNYKATSQLTTTMGQYKWVILFALANILVIQYVDQNLIKKGKGVV
jgi:hypothetical protein